MKVALIFSYMNFVLSAFLILLHLKQSLASVKGEKRIMNGVNLKISAYNFHPLFKITKIGQNSTYSGLAVEIIDFYCQYFNMTVKFVEITNLDVSEKGIIDALINQLETKVVDAILYPFEQILENLKHMAMLYPFFIAKFNLIQPFPQEESRLLVIIRPFSATVWILLIASICAFIASWSILSFYKDQGPHGKRVANLHTAFELTVQKLEYVITTIFNQGNSIAYNTDKSIKIIVTTWLLSLVVLSNGYTSVLTALLTVPKYEPIVDSLDKLVTNGRFTLTLLKNSSFMDYILEATGGVYKELGDLMRLNRTSTFSDLFEMTANILTQNSITILETELSKFYILEDKKIHGECRMTVSPKPLTDYFMNVQTGIAKESPFLNSLNMIAIKLWDCGLATYWKKKYFPSDEECLADKPPEKTIKSFTLQNLSISFTVLIIGIVVSFVSFLFENAFYRLYLNSKILLEQQ